MYDKRNFRTFFLILVVFLFLVVPSSAITWSSASGCWTAVDGSYNIVMWNATGASSWNPAGVTTVEVLVVAGGGGGGGSNYGGGGGAGGLIEHAAKSVSGTTQIFVGAGGAGGDDDDDPSGQTGNDSQFSDIVAKGGGGGGGYSIQVNGKNGGSGGGGSTQGGGVNGAAGVHNDGTVGGGTFFGNDAGTGFSDQWGGGAGAAGGAGVNAVVNKAGGGGAGRASDIIESGVNVIYAAGGGGGCYVAGQQGVGGSTPVGGSGGANAVAATVGRVNTGSGGGGAGWTSVVGASGGSGIVIIRYLVATPTPTPTPTTTTTTTGGVTACTLTEISWCQKQDLFYWNETSDVDGFQVLRNYPQLSNEAYNYTSVSRATGQRTVARYISPNFTAPVVIAPGLWLFTSYFNVSSAVEITQYEFKVFNRSSTGTMTNLFYGHAITDDVNSLTPELHLLTYARRNWTFLNTGDRLVIEVNASTTSVVARNAWISIAGNLHASSVEAGQFLCCYGSSASCAASVSEYTIPNLPVVQDGTWGLPGWAMRNAWWLILLIGAYLILKRK